MPLAPATCPSSVHHPYRKLVPVKFRLPPETYDAEPPPFLGSWRRVYLFVLGWLAFLIAVFYAFTRYFA